MNFAIILSGGVGSRTGLDIPKQYYEFDGRPLIQYVINTIEECDELDGYVIVATDEWISFIQKIITEIDCKKDRFLGYATPGANRQLSIYNGLLKLKEVAAEKDIVLIQDAARPFTSVDLIHNCFSLSEDEDGAMPVIPMTDTVYLSKDGKTVHSLLNRSEVFAGQAPESFRFGKYIKANEALLPDAILKINGSTEPAIMAGMSISMIDGDRNNIKITTASDFEYFLPEDN